MHMTKSSSNLKIYIAFFGAALLVVAGVLAYFYFTGPQDTWIALKRGPIVESVYGLGTVTADRELKLKPGVASTIQKIFVKEGDQVTAGTALIKLSELPVMKAPFDGTITDLPFKEGENIFPQIPILTLMDLKNLYLNLVLEQTSAIQVRANQKVTLAFESLRNQRFEGVVQSITPKEGQFSVRIQVAHLPEGILPGMTADCAIAVAKRDSANLIPLKAIKNGKIQYKAAGTSSSEASGAQKSAAVKIGVVDGEWAELLEPKFSNNESVEILVSQNRKP